jgi:hypothetical protein
VKILLSFLQDTTDLPHPVPAYRFWSYYLKNGITEAGMQWLETPATDWAEGLMYLQNPGELERWKAKVWQLTLEHIKSNRHQIDIFLCYLYPGQIDPSAIAEIKKQGIPCINFYCDNVREFEKVPLEFTVFDLIWVPEYEALPMYKRAGINYTNLPMPMWVDYKHRQGIPVSELPGISFVGSKDLYREQLLGEIINKGVNVTIRGSGWQKVNDIQASVKPTAYHSILNQINFIKDKGLKALLIKTIQKNQDIQLFPINPELIQPIPDFAEYIHIIQNSTITLGINRVFSFKRTHLNPLVYSRLRDIEAPMLGACYLTEYSEGLRNIYDLGAEIYTYKDAAELIDKAHELLTDQAKRETLRLNGRHKALTELSIPNSLQKIKSIIYQ